MRYKTSIILLLLFLYTVVYSKTISNIVFDKSTMKPIESVNVFCLTNEALGTSTNAQGEFRLKIKRSMNLSLSDTIVFSSIGYRSERIAIRDLLFDDERFIYMSPIVVYMDMVSIRPIEYTLNCLGVKNNKNPAKERELSNNMEINCDYIGGLDKHRKVGTIFYNKTSTILKSVIIPVKSIHKFDSLLISFKVFSVSSDIDTFTYRPIVENVGVASNIESCTKELYNHPPLIVKPLDIRIHNSQIEIQIKDATVEVDSNFMVMLEIVKFYGVPPDSLEKKSIRSIYKDRNINTSNRVSYGGRFQEVFSRAEQNDESFVRDYSVGDILEADKRIGVTSIHSNLVFHHLIPNFYVTAYSEGKVNKTEGNTSKFMSKYENKWFKKLF